MTARMLERQTISGRGATVVYLTKDLEPATKQEHELVKVLFDDGELLWLIPEAPVAKLGESFLRKLNRGRALPKASAKPDPLLERRLRIEMKSFLAEVRLRLVKQAVAAYAKLSKGEQEDLDIIDEVMSQIDFSIFNTLPKRVQAIMEKAYAGAAESVLGSIGVAVKANKGAPELNDHAFNQINEDAVAYARERSASMVGMKYVDDQLVPNPNAKWQISDSTRDGIRGTVAEVVKGNLPSKELADTLRASYEFSPARATMIARTELKFATGNGALAGYKASGVVDKKVWLTAGDGDEDEDCAANEDEGPIPVDDDFQSGDECEPAHPNCRCTIAPYVEWDDEPETDEADQSTDDESADEE